MYFFKHYFWWTDHLFIVRKKTIGGFLWKSTCPEAGFWTIHGAEESSGVNLSLAGAGSGEDLIRLNSELKNSTYDASVLV